MLVHKIELKALLGCIIFKFQRQPGFEVYGCHFTAVTLVKLFNLSVLQFPH